MGDPSNTNTEGGFVNTGSISASGDVVGRDKIVYGYTYEQALELIQSIRQVDQPSVWDGRAPMWTWLHSRSRMPHCSLVASDLLMQ